MSELDHLSSSWRLLPQPGHFLGSFFWTFVPKKRKVLAQQQILDCGITDDPKRAMAIAKASTQRFGPMMIEVLRYPVYTKEKAG